MARILYGVISIGLGHAIRSRVLIEYLIKQKHKVLVVTSYGVYAYYRKYYKDVLNIEGLEIIFRNNAILNLRTFVKNLRKASKNTYEKWVKVRRKIVEFDPEIVISDMETFTSYWAHNAGVPLISINNQSYLLYGKYDYPKKYRLSRLKAIFIIKSIMFRAKYDLVMCFPGCKIEDRTGIFQIDPVLRDEIINAKPKKMDYIFVYQSTKSYEKLIDILKRINYKFIIYGFEKNQLVGNLIFKKFNDGREFVNDLTNSKAVISNGGFTLISEALHLGKPLLVVPIKKHFEQILNALYVKENNFGEFYTDLNENHVVEFIMNLKKYNFEKVKKWENEKAFRLLDMLIRKERP